MANYICVKDRLRAEVFYKTLFSSAALMANDRFVFFDLGGFIFGLFVPEHEQEWLQHRLHDTPQLRVPVTDVTSELGKIKAMRIEIVQPLQMSAEAQFFQFLDTEGNTVEFFQALKRARH